MIGESSEVDFKEFFEALPSPHIVVCADDDLTVVCQNAAHAKISLTKRKGIVGLPLLTAFPDTSPQYSKDGTSDLAESFKKVVRTGKPDRMPHFKYDLKMGDGTVVERWWKVSHHPLFNGNKEVSFVYQVTEDITDEVKSKHLLRESKTILDSALGIGLVSTWSWDMKNDVVRGDATLASQFGVSVKEAETGLPLKRFTDSIHPEDRAQVVKEIEATIRNRGTFEKEYRTVTADKKEYWVVARGSILTDEDDMPTTFGGIIIDITSRKQAEKELKQSLDRYETLFDSPVVAIALADVTGRIMQANTTFLKMFGYTQKDIEKGLTSADVSYSSNSVSNRTIYNSIKKTGILNPTRKEYVRKDGTRFSGLVGATMLRGSDDTFMAFIVDVTENEKLKEISQLKDEFIAIASHQLRTPASTVKQYLGVLKDGYAGEVSDQQRKYLDIADAANEREIRIVDDLLKTARLDTQGAELILEPVDIADIVREVVGRFIPVAENKKQTIKLSISDKLFTIKGDASELCTSIENLVENASKYSAENTIIKVNLTAKHKYIVISVSDQGVGISQSSQSKIFDKFTRVRNPYSHTVSGSGLGLYWVKRIAELHGGKCDVTSKPGVGTTFSIRLPYE